jgi:hypothetical protein
MNCKPGDLARVVHPGNNLGKIIRVTTLDPVPHSVHGHCWHYEGGPLMATEFNAPLSAYCDVWLRPIRDPGDDAVDESHAWLPPVPTAQPDRVSDREADHAFSP